MAVVDVSHACMHNNVLKAVYTEAQHQAFMDKLSHIAAGI